MLTIIFDQQIGELLLYGPCGISPNFLLTSGNMGSCWPAFSISLLLSRENIK